MTDQRAPADLDGAVLDELERLARAATPGPYEAVGGCLTDWRDHTFSMEWMSNGSYPNERSDLAYFVAANPQTVLSLISALRQAREVEMVEKPTAWMRRWAFVGEVPAKVRNPETGRMKWHSRFKWLPVTASKILPDDVPLYAQRSPYSYEGKLK